MIYSLDGTLTYFDQNFAVVSCGGVGFKCFTTLTTLQSLPGVGKPVQLFTYLSVREECTGSLRFCHHGGAGLL